jgi:hypothetical protein
MRRFHDIKIESRICNERNDSKTRKVYAMIWNCRLILAVSCEDFEEVLNLISNQNVLVLHMIDVLLSLTFPWMG